MILQLSFFILITLLNQDNILIQQDSAFVPVSDVDAFIHDLPPFMREKISKDNKKLESDILSMLNMNIIFDYIQNTKLNELPQFKDQAKKNLSKPINLDKSFYKQLNIEADIFEDNYRSYLLKKTFYSTFQEYLVDNVEENKVLRLAQDRFTINKENYKIPDKRDISMIKLSQDKFNQTEVLEVVKSLRSDDSAETFKRSAKKLSQDSTVKYNDGQLGQFHQEGFRYPFAEKVFSAEVGTVPAVFEKDGFWYIVRVNKIIPAKPADFEDYKDELVAKIKVEMMERQFQSIIDEYAKHKVQVNKELVDDIFSRYEVFR